MADGEMMRRGTLSLFEGKRDVVLPLADCADGPGHSWFRRGQVLHCWECDATGLVVGPAPTPADPIAAATARKRKADGLKARLDAATELVRLAREHFGLGLLESAERALDWR